MALPVAQLGYMPNVGAPSARPTYQVRDPWEDLAMQVLGAVAGAGVSNVMSRDYATQAAMENPEQISVGQAVSPQTGQPVAGAVQPGRMDPTNASFWSKLVQGPQMNAQQYGQVSTQRTASAEADRSRKHASTEKEADRGLTRTENSADRTSRETLTRAQLQAAAEQFNKRQTLDESQLLLQQQVAQHGMQTADVNTALKGAEVGLDARRIDAAAGPQVAAERAAVQVYQAYADYATNYAKLAMGAQLTGQPAPPLMSYEQFVAEYNKGRPSFGLPQFSGKLQ